MIECISACRNIHKIADEIIREPTTKLTAGRAEMKNIRAKCAEIQRLCEWMERNCCYDKEPGGLPGDDY
jgi:hypothetical protein